MIWVVRFTALVVELGGLFYIVRHLHHGEYVSAFLLLLFDTVVVVVFVVSHCLVESILTRYEPKARGRWWL